MRAPDRHLVSAAELAGFLGDPRLRLADVRWYVGEPGRNRAAYAAGHLSGAVFLDVDTDLSAPTGPGRHPLPDPDDFAALLAGRGFGDDHVIVAYDDADGVYAARLWWMLRWIGHPGARLLDGGLRAWRAAGHALSTDESRHPPATMTVRPGPTRLIDRDDLWRRLGTVVLLDARQPDRYTGEQHPVDPLGGHIPTARSAPTSDNLGPDGRFLPAEELARHYRALGAGVGDTVASCGSGVTACHDILAMSLAGLPEPILYPGSWSDWCTSGLPYATGPEPGAV
ncbi:MAG TPA: sulfurtransferase [Acidimicrobiia bacterium]|nr:sulfurtransferase [Acidimicrobiia bacterium]